MKSGVLNGKIGDRTVVTVGKHTGDGHFIVSFKPILPVTHLQSESEGVNTANQLLQEFIDDLGRGARHEH